MESMEYGASISVNKRVFIITAYDKRMNFEYHIPGQPTNVQKRTLSVLQSPSIIGLAQTSQADWNSSLICTGPVAMGVNSCEFQAFIVTPSR
jgi:hypothetical protein